MLLGNLLHEGYPIPSIQGMKLENWDDAIQHVGPLLTF